MHSIFIQTYIKDYLIIILYFYTKVNGFGIKSLTSRVKKYIIYHKDVICKICIYRNLSK